MTLEIIGNINMSNAHCEKCGESIYIKARSDTIVCNHCGATYELTREEKQDQSILYEYNFKEFRCIYNTFTGRCDNVCPTLRMFCRDHISDKNFEDAKNSLSYYEKKVREIEDTIYNMEESKRVWLIQEMSGINDDTI